MTKEELKQEFEKYLKDSVDYYDPREPLTERKLLQIWLDSAEPRENRIAELEQENAELKSVADFQTSSNMDRFFQLKRSKEQLTKAKEIMRSLLADMVTIDGEQVMELKAFKEAEQFLNSEVEK